MVRVHTNHISLQERELVVTKTPPSEPPPRARFKSRLHLRAWLGSTPERRRPQIRGFRAGGSLAVANSTPATQLLSPAKMLKLNHAQNPRPARADCRQLSAFARIRWRTP
jgi:hypothetical protein